MIRMVFFAPYPEILPVIRQVFSERPDREEFHYEVVQDFFNNPLENINADVAIARGFTAHSMQKKCIVTNVDAEAQYRKAMTLNADGLEAVSYTHLTLPTKLEV